MPTRHAPTSPDIRLNDCRDRAAIDLVSLKTN